MQNKDVEFVLLTDCELKTPELFVKLTRVITLLDAH